MANQNGHGAFQSRRRIDHEHGYQDERDQRDREAGRDDFRGNTDHHYRGVGQQVDEYAERDRTTGYGDSSTGRDSTHYRGQSGSQAGGGYDQAWRGQGVRGGSEGRWGDMDQGGRSRGPHAGKGPRGYKPSDERITEAVNDALTNDDFVDATEIAVEVREGEATLTGTVEDRGMKRRAELVVEAVSGVRDVHNQIRLKAHS